MGRIAYPQFRALIGMDRCYTAISFMQMPTLNLVILWIVWLACIAVSAWIIFKLLKYTASNLRERAIRSRNIRDKSIEDILAGKYADAGLGGSVVLAQTKIPKAMWKQIFTPVADENSLVSFVLKGDIQIDRVILDTTTEDQKSQEFIVLIILKNRTQEEMRFNIPKGQVFENRFPEALSQNLVASDSYEQVVLSGNEKKNIRVDAYCLNKNLPPPDGNIGNLTIFELRNKNFVNQAQLWEMIDKAIQKVSVND